MVILVLLALGCEKEENSPDWVVIPDCEAGSVVLGETWTGAELLGSDDQTGFDWLQEPNYAGPGMAAVDLDGDGWLDIAIANPLGPSHVLMGSAKGFSKGSVVVPQSFAIGAGDLNGDGRPDLLVSRWDGAAELVGVANASGDYTWSEVPNTVQDQGVGWSLADMDGDGDLDAYNARHRGVPDNTAITSGQEEGVQSMLFRNEGGTLVLDETALSRQQGMGMTFLGQWLDANEDGHLDLYQVRDFGPFVTPNLLLLGDGKGGFFGSDGSANIDIYSMGVAVGDVDGNGSPDLYITNIGSPVLLSNQAGRYVEATAAQGAYLAPSAERQSSWGVDLVDLDLDGFPEAAVLFGSVQFWGEPATIADSEGTFWKEGAAQPDALLWNKDGKLVEVPGLGDTAVGRGLVRGDWDRDGDPDLMTASWTPDLDIQIARYETLGGCGHGATLQVPVGTRITTLRGTQWLAPANSFSSSADELYFSVDISEEVEVQLPGHEAQTYFMKAGDILRIP